MIVIFQDIDGVLNRDDTKYLGFPRDEHGKITIPIHRPCVDRLNRLTTDTGAKLVISSSWRKFARWQDLGPALNAHGVLAETVGETPDLINDQAWLAVNRWARDAHERIERGHEIREFLRTTKLEIEQFVILDDCSDMADVREYLVLTDSREGLDDPDVERAKYLLPRSADYLDDLAWSGVGR